MRTRLSLAHRLLVALVALLMALAPSAVAQAKKRSSAAKPAGASAAPAKPAAAQAESTDGDTEAQTKVKVERGAGGKKVYRIEGEIVIEGKIQKPEAFYVLQKSSINYDWHELKQEFVPKILDSVTKAPF
jgi:hypothetical protein